MDGRRCRVLRDRGSKTRVDESAQPPHQCFVGCVFLSDVERFAPALLFFVFGGGTSPWLRVLRCAMAGTDRARQVMNAIEYFITFIIPYIVLSKPSGAAVIGCSLDFRQPASLLRFVRPLQPFPSLCALLPSALAPSAPHALLEFRA